MGLSLQGIRDFFNPNSAYLQQIADLQSEREDLVSQNLRLQDRCDHLESDRLHLWEIVKDAIRNERGTYQSELNAQWQMKGWGVRYPEAAHLEREATPDTKPQSGVGGRELPSTRINRETKKFIDNYVSSHIPNPSTTVSN